MGAARPFAAGILSELLVVESIAVAKGKSARAVVAEYARTRSWAAVARQNRINPGSLTARLRNAGRQMHSVAERSYEQQRRNNVNDNYGRMQGNAQSVAVRAG
jgi:hypothetical protein